MAIGYLYLDFDSFFATAEQHFNPALRGRPLGVVPLNSAHTGCIALSREAKALGMKMGITVTAAREICPDMVFVQARHDAYVRLHKAIIERIETCLPIGAIRSVDEVVCHLTPAQARRPEETGSAIKATLCETFSPVLTCSIGMAASELLAKVAAEMDKPDGLVVLHQSHVPQQLAALRLRDFPGISRGMERRLALAGVTDVPALWQLSRKHMRAIWRSVEGERFWCGLHGHPVSRPATVKRMFGHGRMLPLDWRTPARAHTCLRWLTMSAARRLRRAGLCATALYVSLRGRGDSDRWHAERRFPAARDDHTFLTALGELMEGFADESAGFAPKSASVMLQGLKEPREMTGDLFLSGSTPGEDARRARWENVCDTLDALRRRMGPDAVRIGFDEKVPGGYLGAKIAFGRIPDEADFSDAPRADADTLFYTGDLGGHADARTAAP